MLTNNSNGYQLHPLFEALATDHQGNKIRGRRYRRGGSLSGDAYQYAYGVSNIDHDTPDNVESDLLQKTLAKLQELFSEQDISFLCSVYPIGPVSLRQLAKQTDLSVATWSRLIRRVFAQVQSELGPTEVTPTL